MAIPIRFDEQNFVFGPAPGDEYHVGELPVWAGRMAFGSEDDRYGLTANAIISCWQPTEEERQAIANGGPIWLTVVSTDLAPVIVGARKPDMNITPEEFERFRGPGGANESSHIDRTHVAKSQEHFHFCSRLYPNPLDIPSKSVIHICLCQHSQTLCGKPVLHQYGKVTGPGRDEQGAYCEACEAAYVAATYGITKHEPEPEQESISAGGVKQLVHVYAGATYASSRRNGDNIHFAIKGESSTLCDAPVFEELPEPIDGESAEGVRYCKHCTRIALKR